MVWNCEPGRIHWKSPGCECWLASAHTWRQCWSALARGLLMPPSEGPNKIREIANLRHRNGAVSFFDVFPCTTTLFGAEWLSAPVPSATHRQRRDTSYSTGMRKGWEAPAKGWEQAAVLRESTTSAGFLAGSTALRGWASGSWPHLPGSTETCDFDPLKTEVSSEVSAVTCGGGARIPQHGLTHFLNLLHSTIVNLDQNQCKAGIQIPIPQTGTMTELFIRTTFQTPCCDHMKSQKSMIRKSYFCRPGNVEQEIPQRTPSENTHFYFVHLRYVASPGHYGFEVFSL